MEVQSREGADIVCLFDTLDQVLAWQDEVYAHLPAEKNRPEFFGAQFVVDEMGEFVRENERLLATATSFSVEDLVERVRALGGLTIAAHVDRPTGSLLSNLGFVPPGLPLAALELSARTPPAAYRAQHSELAAWPIIVSGDAHRLSEMRASTLCTLASASTRELELALRARDGRKVKTFA
ncbi:MAG: histidinol phosphatase, partial [Chloroflexota bacterium]